MKNDEPRIERGVPVPTWSRRDKWAHILRKMKVNESVLLPIGTHNAHACASQVFGIGKFICRKVDGGARVWRIK